MQNKRDWRLKGKRHRRKECRNRKRKRKGNEMDVTNRGKTKRIN